jgi:hypothetical protein
VEASITHSPATATRKVALPLSAFAGAHVCLLSALGLPPPSPSFCLLASPSHRAQGDKCCSLDA